MPLPNEPPSTPNASTSSEDAIAYYKAQYEQLESELTDFQTSSRELETELEKDIDASEKRERRLKEKVEKLGYEAEEWKTKYKQAKTEANSAQNTLQKEITTLRDTNRTLQLKLRDIEVANDDFERQARHTTSSLEDLDSKYNVSIERGVLLEEEIKNGEQEREGLRIEGQRLRDELSDLKVDTHILEEKLRKSEQSMRSLHLAPMDRGGHNLHSLDYRAHSPATTTSSPTIATPPTKSTSSVASEAPTPPSPPFSESSTSVSKPITTPIPRPRVSISESNISLPKFSQHGRSSHHSRGPSFQLNNGRNTPSAASWRGPPPSTLPKSGSLYQIRGLIGKMQKLEQRVQSARSRLPAPTDSPPKISPRPGSSMGQNRIPSTVTVRSSRKRSTGSIASSSRDCDSTTPSRIPQGRGSFGQSVTTPSRTGNGDSRPSSRTSMSSCSVNNSSSNGIAQPRPDSRQSLPGSRTPLGHYSSNSMNENRRPRSSLSNFNPYFNMAHIDEGDTEITTPTPTQSLGKSEYSSTAIPTPGGLKKRQSGSNTNIRTTPAIPTPRRVGSTLGRRGSGMLPVAPERKPKVEELGETY